MDSINSQVTFPSKMIAMVPWKPSRMYKVWELLNRTWVDAFGKGKICTFTSQPNMKLWSLPPETPGKLSSWRSIWQVIGMWRSNIHVNTLRSHICMLGETSVFDLQLIQRSSCHKALEVHFQSRSMDLGRDNHKICLALPFQAVGAKDILYQKFVLWIWLFATVKVTQKLEEQHNQQPPAAWAANLCCRQLLTPLAHELLVILVPGWRSKPRSTRKKSNLTLCS